MKSALPSPSWSRSSVRYPVLCSATMTSLLGRTSNRRGCSKPRDKWRDREALHHPWRLSCIWYEQRSACRDWIGFRRRQIFRLNENASAQLLIGIAGGIGGYGLLSGAALLGSGHGTNHPKSQCSRCDCADNAWHEILPVSPSHELPPDGEEGGRVLRHSAMEQQSSHKCNRSNRAAAPLGDARGQAGGRHTT